MDSETRLILQSKALNTAHDFEQKFSLFNIKIILELEQQHSSKQKANKVKGTSVACGKR